MFVAHEVSAEPALQFDSSLTTARIYDSNILAKSTQRESDLIWRVSPSIGAEYKTGEFDWNGSYILDAERYAMHPELDSWHAQRSAGMDTHYQPNERLGLSFNGAYIKTNRPGELLPGAALELGRVRSSSLTLDPSVTFLFNSRTTGYADYRRVRNDIQDGIATRTDTMTFRLSRQTSNLDNLSLAHETDLYEFGSSPGQRSQVLIAGWDRKLNPLLTMSLKAGPRHTGGSTTLDATAELRLDSASGELSMRYRRTQMTVVGLAYPVTFWGWTLNAAYHAGTNFTLSLTPGYARYQAAGTRADVYLLNVEADYGLSHSITVTGSCQYTDERGILGQSGSPGIRDLVVFVGIRFSSKPNNVGITAITVPSESDNAVTAGGTVH